MGEGVWDRLRQLEEKASKKGVRLGAVSGLDFAIMHAVSHCIRKSSCAKCRGKLRRTRFMCIYLRLLVVYLLLSIL